MDWQLVLLVILLSFPRTISNSNVDIEVVKENVKEVLALTEPVVDGLEKLKRVGEKATVLLKLLGPAGSIIATGISTILKDDPEELKAVRDLQTKMAKRFDLLENEVSNLGTKIENTPALLGYDDKISLGISRLEESYLATINDQPRDPYRSIYMDACKSVLSTPFFMLDYIKTVVVDRCTSATISQTSLHVEAYAMLDRVEKLMNSSPNELNDNSESKQLRAFTKDKNGFAQSVATFCFNGSTLSTVAQSAIYDQLNAWETAIAQLDKEAIELSVTEVRRTLRFLTNDIPGVERCLPNAVANLNLMRRSTLDSLAGIVAYDVVRTVEMSAICAALIFDDKTRQEKLADLKYKAELIASELTQWIKTKLDSTWPDVIRMYAEQSVLSDVTDVNNAAVYTPIAEQIRNIANERTFYDKKTPTNDHQVLVMETWQGEDYFHSSCGPTSDRCIVVQNYKMINFVICRHAIDPSSTFHKENALRMNEWVKQNEGGIQEMTQSKQSILPLKDLLKYLRQFYDYRAFKSGTIVLVRKLYWLESSTYINVGLATSHVAGQNETAVIETFCPHRFPDLTDHVRFKLFFFA